VRDVDLGVKLGFARPEDIRKIIRRHEKTLRKINVLRAAPLNLDPEHRACPAKAYSLTAAQAMFIISKAGTAVAEDVFAEIAIAVAKSRRSSGHRPFGAISGDQLAVETVPPPAASEERRHER